MSVEDTEDSGLDLAMSEDLAVETKLDGTDPVQYELMTRLGQLEEALLARDPMMKTHLAAIHKNLIVHEELVHLLSDAEIGKIVAAQQAHTNTFLLQEVTAKTGKAKVAARTAKLGLSDL